MNKSLNSFSKQKDFSLPNWSDMSSIRDWINGVTYGNKAVGTKWFRLVIGAVLFTIIVRATLELHETLLMQFVLGAILLHFSEASLTKFWPSKSVSVSCLLKALDQNDSPFKEPTCRLIHLGLVAGIFDLQAERGKDFPLQQNALLIISLLWLSQQPAPSSVDLLFLFVSFFALKAFEQSRNSTEKWRLAHLAIRELFIDTQRKQS
jgi:hypothetical protein